MKKVARKKALPSGGRRNARLPLAWNAKSSKNGKNGRNGKNRAALAYDSSLLTELLEGLDVAVAHLNIDGIILYANQKFMTMLGVPLYRTLVARDLRDFFDSDARIAMSEALERAQQESVEGEVRIETTATATATATARVLKMAFNPIHRPSSVSIRVTATEVTELMAAQTALQESETSMRELSARILQLQDEERRRIARDLHDTTGQELAVTVLSLKQVAENLDKPGFQVRQKILDAVSLTKKVNDEIRTLSYLLHPPLLDEFGLCAALNWYVDGFRKRSQLNVDLQVPENVPRLLRERETALFRVVQEGLTNALKYSGAKRVEVRLSATDQKVTVHVKDAGKGMDPRTLERVNRGTGMVGVGIAGLRERFRQFGGELKITSGPQGTTLAASVIVDRDATASVAQAGVPETAAETSGQFPAIGAPAAKATEKTRVRVLVADDHEVVRRGVRALLEDEGDLEVCGEAADGLEAIHKVRELKPDLILLDLSMPKTSGASVASHICRSGLPTKILVFTTHGYPGLEEMLRQVGCHGVVRKTNAPNDLIVAIRAVLNGREFFGAESSDAKGAKLGRGTARAASL
jgi:signal transduction histidine kinase/CheY-like chemotaxis protein